MHCAALSGRAKFECFATLQQPRLAIAKHSDLFLPAMPIDSLPGVGPMVQGLGKAMDIDATCQKAGCRCVAS